MGSIDCTTVKSPHTYPDIISQSVGKHQLERPRPESGVLTGLRSVKALLSWLQRGAGPRAAGTGLEPALLVCGLRAVHRGAARRKRRGITTALAHLALHDCDCH